MTSLAPVWLKRGVVLQLTDLRLEDVDNEGALSPSWWLYCLGELLVVPKYSGSKETLNYYVILWRRKKVGVEGL